MKTLLSLKNKLTDYYPYGEPWREPAGQPWLYSGNERLREDGINEYDFNARRYNSALGMFTTWDPLAEKRPWDSPYAFCAGDPVNHSDPTGLILDFSNLLLFDKINQLGVTEKILHDLSRYTGLNLYIDQNNCLKFEINENEMPVINQSLDNSGNIINEGSEVARNLLLHSITSPQSISVMHGKRCVYSDQQLGISYFQILKFINGAVNVSSETMGFGMIFLHELLHSPLGGNLKDNKRKGSKGKVVEKMNSIRRELNKQGYDLGERQTYSPFELDGNDIIPFDFKSLNALNGGDQNLNNSKYIKYER